MGSSRTGLEIEDTSRTNFGDLGLGLGFGLEDSVLEHILAVASMRQQHWRTFL